MGLRRKTIHPVRVKKLERVLAEPKPTAQRFLFLEAFPLEVNGKPLAVQELPSHDSVHGEDGIIEPEPERSAGQNLPCPGGDDGAGRNIQKRENAAAPETPKRFPTTEKDMPSKLSRAPSQPFSEKRVKPEKRFRAGLVSKA